LIAHSSALTATSPLSRVSRDDTHVVFPNVQTLIYLVERIRSAYSSLSSTPVGATGADPGDPLSESFCSIGWPRRQSLPSAPSSESAGR
jgi:hypothetical protein